MALSGLWENVIFTKPYLPQMVPVCLTDTNAKRGKTGTLGRRTILTNVKSICAPMYVLGMGILVMGNRILPEMEDRVVLPDLISNVGQLEIAQVVIEGWVINPYEQDLLDGPSNAIHLPAHNGETVHIDTMFTMVKVSTLIQCPEMLLYS